MPHQGALCRRGAHQGTVTSAQLLSSTLGGSRAVSANVSSSRPSAAGPASPAPARAAAPAGALPAAAAAPPRWAPPCVRAAPLPSPVLAPSHAPPSGPAVCASRELVHAPASPACPPARSGHARAGPPPPGAPGAGARPKPSRAARTWPASAGSLASADGPDAVKACSTEQAAVPVHDALEWTARRRSAGALTQAASGHACSSGRAASGGARAWSDCPVFPPVLGQGQGSRGRMRWRLVGRRGGRALAQPLVVNMRKDRAARALGAVPAGGRRAGRARQQPRGRLRRKRLRRRRRRAVPRVVRARDRARHGRQQRHACARARRGQSLLGPLPHAAGHTRPCPQRSPRSSCVLTSSRCGYSSIQTHPVRATSSPVPSLQHIPWTSRGCAAGGAPRAAS